MKILTFINKRDSFLLLFLTIFALGLDQASKLLVIKRFIYNPEPIELLPFFKIVLLLNQGVSFSFLKEIDYRVLLIISFLALLIAILMIASLFRNSPFKMVLALSLLIGSSLGNIIDRFRYKGVVDFLLVHYNDFMFPIFNLADIMLTLCAMILIYEIIFNKKNVQKSKLK
ncbi:Signal peptidase II [Candidatus Hepatincolaceae symbiont of Richtersius coronifer]